MPTSADTMNESTCNYSSCNSAQCQNDSLCANYSQASLFYLRAESDFFIIANGYGMPIVILVTVILNSLVCLILLKPNMRSPTNMILVLMAVCDTLTGLFPIPAYLYYFGGWRLREPVPYNLCQMVDLSIRALPTIFHTASIWITLMLAVQRYVYVCHSFKARQWCTIANVLKASAVIMTSSIVFHFPLLIDRIYIPMILEYPPNSTESMTGCLFMLPHYLSDTEVQTWFFNVYFYFRVFFIHILPCVALVILNALLIRTMHQAKKRRKQLLQQNKKSECRKLQESNSTTLMMVAVVGVFLVVEFPSGVIFALFAMCQTWPTVFENALNQKALNFLIQLFNYGIVISYPFNFFIYCRMSRQFRETFRALFTKGSVSLDREHSQYTSLPNENGRLTHNNEETAI